MQTIPIPPLASASAGVPAAQLPVGAAPPAASIAQRDKFPAEPCLEQAADFREYSGCWSEHIEGVRDDLDALVAAERERGKASNPASAKLLKEQASWESKRDAACNALDHGNMGQGLGSVGQLAVGKCRYDADRKRLARFQEAGTAPARLLAPGSTR